MQCSFKDVQTGQIIKIDIKPSWLQWDSLFLL
jgi:hypothetical protein